MPNEEQLDIREMDGEVFRLEFPYNEAFIAFIKFKVPYQDRSYDEDTKVWTIHGGHYIGHLEGVALRHFRHVARTFRRGTDLVIKNVRTGSESVQAGLF